MVGIFAPLNGEPWSDFSMRCCDLLHNHSCQLAHYGFCPKPLSDVRRALFSLAVSWRNILCPFPHAHQGETELMLEKHWRKPVAEFVVIVVVIPPLFLFRTTVSCLEVVKVLRDNKREANVFPEALSAGWQKTVEYRRQSESLQRTSLLFLTRTTVVANRRTKLV